MDPTDTCATPLAPEEYGTEVLCASWNPAASAVAEPAMTPYRKPADLAADDAESFLSQYYRNQQS
ncbi:MAG TPA: hypothetical protein VFK15_16355 [Burkholderiales bacterium]|nr:hypothetical protein [Burkholderiales bacterium]